MILNFYQMILQKYQTKRTNQIFLFFYLDCEAFTYTYKSEPLDTKKKPNAAFSFKIYSI